MTIEIRELVIQAKVSSPDDRDAVRTQACPGVDDRILEERLIQLITRRVFEQLRDEGWGQK
jgi:Family of unknown function (DUF5908)